MRRRRISFLTRSIQEPVSRWIMACWEMHPVGREKSPLSATADSIGPLLSNLLATS